MDEQTLNLLFFIILVAVGYFSGRYLEKRHYHSIENREQRYTTLPLVSFDEDSIEPEREIQYVRLVSGNAVISIDYFKRFFSMLQVLVGGRVTAYQTLVDRARREALLRMTDQARTADIIANVRIETSAIGQRANQKGQVGSVEAIAYGTAVKYKQDAVHSTGNPS